ncbi:MAG: hypothetical protein M1839_006216 [Geoglossum umbratile]|nr:MAG: hypothetical protein M1839_006216 [Geoglossum umbratile]
MPCFKGLAISIHTNDGPLPEYSILKQSRTSRITTYIPVPPPRIPTDSTTNKPEQSTFAISITLLTPGLAVPYSTPKATRENPNPRAKVVGDLPGFGEERSKYIGVINPYMPLTSSPNETIAAYIYFDGRKKEEVATLLRRGEETWVNSRWVSVPEVEGGGLAEREFLFREVGLERWLNGLDLDGKDAAAKLERRRQRLEKKRRKRRDNPTGDTDPADMQTDKDEGADTKSVLRYASRDQSPVESDDDIVSDSDSEAPQPEATGQIKIALFRVLASGEVKRGEYSPQFDAHDDDESEGGRRGRANGDAPMGEEPDVDHTTSFAEPKTLDPKSISTQTVTAIDGPEKPYAVFTFFYRGERVLQKMRILPSPKSPGKTTTPAKRRSIQTDFSNLAPLTTTGTVGFTSFRDTNPDSPPRSTKRKGRNSIGGAMDADSEDEDDEADKPKVKIEDTGDDEDEDKSKVLLSIEDARKQGELTEGVRKIKLKRAHSAEPLGSPSPQTSYPAAKSPSATVSTPVTGTTPPNTTDPATTPPASKPTFGATAHGLTDDAMVGSPLKKQRASISGLEDEAMRRRLGMLGSSLQDALGDTDKDKIKVKEEMDEDL